MRYEPDLSVHAAADLARDHIGSLRRSKLLPEKVDPGALAKYAYLAHHEGIGKAKMFLRGDMSYVTVGHWEGVPRSQRESYLRRNGGNMQEAYRDWLIDYTDQKFDPRQFMHDARGVQVPSLRDLLQRRDQP